ncbi:MAG: SGNH/GDSL hydrolase family protein [Roseivirga sp.]
MKNIKTYVLALLAFAVVISACDEDKDLLDQRLADNPLPDPTTGDSGTIDLSTFISVGNSLTAGYLDGALYTNAQDHSFANLLGQQFQISGIGGGAFTQPDINSQNGFSSLGPNGPLGRFELSLSLLRPVPTVGEVPTAYAGDKSALRNFAVPGMRLVDIADASLAARNPLYARFASNPGTSTVLGDATAVSPTFFSFWLGANDVLGYATSGGVDESRITDAASFQASLQTSLGALVATGAKGVVLTLPPVVVAPFFRAVPYNAIPMTDQATVDQLNGAFAGLNAALAGLAQFNLITTAEATARSVSYSLGANPILMHDDELTDLGPMFDILLGAGAISAAQRAALQPFVQSRPATPNDLPTLSSATVLGTAVGGNPAAVIGVSVPAPDNLILSASEVVRVVTARATYNAVIAGVVNGVNAQAGANTISIVDVQPIFADLFGLTAASATALALSPAAVAAADGQLGIEIDGVTLAPDFGPNGVVSTDGIHPNPRGHAIIANTIISSLNSVYGASIPSINVLNLRGVITTN